jgi:hypothetical protein
MLDRKGFYLRMGEREEREKGECQSVGCGGRSGLMGTVGSLI